ncbi:MAG TPA: CBS domain-containing protein [Bacteroidia bacterium]|nr:CBS domain-containing protein [Bacteroidia bacterium]
MLARSLIKDIIPPLKITDAGERALSWMEEFRTHYLPVVNSTNYLGIISETDILGLANKSLQLGNYAVPLDRVFIYENQHVYDAVRFVSNYNYPIIPVLDNDQHYAGLLTVTDLIESFAELFAVNGPGGIIQLEVNQKDYMLSEIAKLVEGNDAHIMSLNVNPSPDQLKMEITIKVDKTDLSRIIESLYRYNYNVKTFYHQSEFSEDLQERYEAFMNYLKM